MGKLAVGSVIVGRVQDSRFPDTVSKVICQKNQFPGAYWFNGKGKACWASRNKDLLYTIGDHALYG